MVFSRKKALTVNAITSMLQEILIVVFGLILPRITLAFFGSTYNGLVNSITQFLSFSVVLRSGLGAVTGAALYAPLAKNDCNAISGIMVATDRFMKKIGYLLAIIIVLFSLLYPFLVLDEFDYLFSFSLILIIGASSFVENMFSVKYKVLLQADQKYYVQTFVTMLAYLLSNVVSIVLIVSGFNIHIVKLGALLGLATTPVMLKIYVDKHYDIDWNALPNEKAIKSRWDAFAQQLATVVNNNASPIIMSFFFPLKEVSVYTVYHMVIKNINQIIVSAFSSLRATFGNMFAKGETDILVKRFKDVEWMVLSGGAILYTVTGSLLTPFVLLYTKGITDANYNRFWFGILMTASAFVYSSRIPYQVTTEAVGLFKETRNSSILEIISNVLVSIFSIPFLGLNGVLIGALCGSIVRVINLVWVCNKKALNISLLNTVKNYLIYFSFSAILLFPLSSLVEKYCHSFISWFVVAALVFAASVVYFVVVSFIFNREQLFNTLKRFKIIKQ